MPFPYGETLPRTSYRVDSWSRPGNPLVTGTPTLRVDLSCTVLAFTTVGNWSSTSWSGPLGNSSQTFLKRWDATRLIGVLHAGCYVSTTNTNVGFGLTLNGTTYELAHQFINPSNQHQAFSGRDYLDSAGAYPAGTHTTDVRVRIKSGSGTATWDSGE